MRRRAIAALALLFLLAAPRLAAQAATPVAPPRGRTPTARPPAKKPPIDFSGVWNLDLQTSKNVVPRLERGLTVTVRQNGSRIWMEASGPDSPKASDVIVADGRPYKKDLGPGLSATVTAQWAPDGTAMLMEIVAGDPKTPQVVQRTRWTLSPDKKNWYRHTITLDGSERRETGLAFRRQSAAPTPRTPAPKKTAAPTKASTP
jgi:hypothetical protein